MGGKAVDLRETPGWPLAAGTVLGKYRIVRFLGEGGMGAVYEGVHLEIGKRVAIKLMSPVLASMPDAQARFALEAQMTARVRHPHTVDVTDICTDGDQAFMVMEYLEGEDLAHHLRRRGPLSVDDAVDVALPTLAAVATAHDAGIIHRDLKPQNIFLARMPGGALHPKVLDFGISKATDSPIKTAGVVLGSPIYFAPEQMKDAKAISPASDQYALGVILYECVTGRLPYQARSLTELFEEIGKGSFPRPGRFRAELPEAFEHIILRAMRLEAHERYANLREMGRALLDFASEKTRLCWQDQFKASARGGRLRAADGLSPVPITYQTPQTPGPSFVPLSDTLSMPRLPPSERVPQQAPGRWILPVRSPVPGSLDGRIPRLFRTARWIAGAGALAAAAWLFGFMMQDRHRPAPAPAVPAPVAAPASMTAAPPAPVATPKQAEEKTADERPVPRKASAEGSRRGHAAPRRTRFGPNEVPLLD